MLYVEAKVFNQRRAELVYIKSAGF